MFGDVTPSGNPLVGDEDAWFGKTPNHWSVLPARALFDESKVTGHENEPLLSVTIKRGVIPQSDLLSDSSKKDSSNVDKSKYKLVEPGDIVYNKMRAWQGALGLSRHMGIVSPAYVVMRPRQTSGRFLEELMRTPAFAKEAERWSYGITSDMWSLRPEHFKLVYFPVPPTDEQASIVKYLGHAHARIDRAIAVKRKLIALLEEQKQAIIHQAVTRGLDPSVPLRDSGIPRLGTIPAHWKVLPLKRLARLKSGAGFPVAAQGRTGLELPFAKVSDMNRPGNEEWIVTADSWISRADAQELGAYVFPPGTVVFPKVGGALLTNKRRRLRIPTCIDNNVMGAVFGHESSDDFGYLTLSLVDMALHVNPGPVPAIGESTVGRIPVAVPPRGEQSDIVAYAVKENESLTGAERQVVREIELLREFRTRLTSDVVTGQVDVREIAATLPELTDDVLASADDEFDDEDELIESEREFSGSDE